MLQALENFFGEICYDGIYAEVHRFLQMFGRIDHITCRHNLMGSGVFREALVQLCPTTDEHSGANAP